MKKMILTATLALAAIPVFSQGQQIIPQKLTISTGFGDTVIAQMADGGGWQTRITVLNLRPTLTTFSIDCYGDTGGPQAFSWVGAGFSSSVNGSLVGSGSSEIVTAGTASTTSQGWCNVTSPGHGPNPSTQPKNDIGAFAIYAYAPNGQQASVPATSWFLTNPLNSLILAYDNTNGYSYGVALVDSNTFTYFGQPNDTVNVSIADQFGNKIATDSFQMVPASHLSFVLADRYPVVSNTRGTVTFSISTSGPVPTLAGLGLRFTPWLAFTSVGMIEPTTY